MYRVLASNLILMIPTPLSGPAYLMLGFRLMWQPGVCMFVVVPLVINILPVIGLFLWLWPPIQASVDGWLALLPGWLLWLGFLVWPLVWILGLLLFGLALTSGEPDRLLPSTAFLPHGWSNSSPARCLTPA